MMAKTGKSFDIIILGSGIGGSILACILAKYGISVLLLEELSHPRFTIGESLIPETGVRLRILGEKHQIPEIGWIGSFYALRDHVSSACGVKRSFSFMYHREGQAHQTDEVNQLPTLTPPMGPDSHLFRQDIDAFMAAIATQYGAEFRQQVKIPKIDLGADGVQLHTAGGEVLKATFLVDAGGMRSQVSAQLGLRDPIPRFRTDTRALYTHMIDLRAADFLVPNHKMPSPLGQATMHHIFDGGWMWIIPFSNHREATNPLTSVGLMLDRRKYPVQQGDPQEEFASIISRYPTIHRHFSTAKVVRPWVASQRLQYSQKHILAHRVIQLPHAASFVDPLYSSGMSVLTVALDLMVDALLPAFSERKFEIERFQRIEDVVNTGFDHYDQIVSRSFDAFRSYDLWNAWNRNWMMGNFMGTWGPLSLLMKYLQTRDRSFLFEATAPGRIGVLSSHVPEIRAAIQASSDDIGEAVSGKMTDLEASQKIFKRLGSLNFLPPYMQFGNSEQRAPSVFTLPMGARHVLWYRRHPEKKWREYCNFSLMTYAREVLDFYFEQWNSSQRRLVASFRDVLFPDNEEWKYRPQALSAHGKRYPKFPESPELKDGFSDEYQPRVDNKFIHPEISSSEVARDLSRPQP